MVFVLNRSIRILIKRIIPFKKIGLTLTPPLRLHL